MSIRAAIVTTDKRPPSLAADLHAAIPAMHPEIFLDQGSYGCTANHLRAWNHLAEQDSTWSLVLEDDAVLCPAFDHQLREVLHHAPSPVVSLYLGRGRPPHWQRRAARATRSHQPFIVSTSLLHAVAVAIRTDWLEGYRGMLAPATRAATEGRKPIDEAITEWCKDNAIPVSYCNPSIVNHNVSLPSVARHQPAEQFAQSQRVAHKFGTRGLPGQAPWGPGIAIM